MGEGSKALVDCKEVGAAVEISAVAGGALAASIPTAGPEGKAVFMTRADDPAEGAIARDAARAIAAIPGAFPPLLKEPEELDTPCLGRVGTGTMGLGKGMGCAAGATGAVAGSAGTSGDIACLDGAFFPPNNNGS